VRVHCDGRILMIQSMPSLEVGVDGWIDLYMSLFHVLTRVLFEKRGWAIS